MRFPNLNPTAFEVFGFEIKWYGISYALGIILALCLCKLLSKKYNKVKEKVFDDILVWVALGIIIGGRIGYVIFYNFDYYISNIFDIFKVWQGGMSFHGGLLGIIVASILFAKKNNQNPFLYMDQIALVAPIGIFFGRIANFINSELYGVPTDVPWSVTFIQIDTLSRHPSQLYEAVLEGIILFVILVYFRKKDYLKKPGLISALFLIIYSFIHTSSVETRSQEMRLKAQKLIGQLRAALQIELLKMPKKIRNISFLQLCSDFDEHVMSFFCTNDFIDVWYYIYR